MKESSKIDVHDDNAVRAAGLIRHYLQTPRDKSVWTKTPSEKQKLRKLKHSCKEDMHFGTLPLSRGTVRARLEVQLKKNKHFPKTTYSFNCLDTEVNKLLGGFTVVQSGLLKTLVAKYSFNGISHVLI